MSNSTVESPAPPNNEMRPVQPKPQRFVVPTVVDGAQLEWRIVVHRDDEPRIRLLAESGNIIKEDDISKWISESAPLKNKTSSWVDSPSVAKSPEFLMALNILRVTKSIPVADIQKLTPERANFAQLITRLREAIELLSNDLPILLEGADKNAAASGGFYRYTPEQIFRLVALAEAAERARDIIVAPVAEAREVTWHETVQLLEWHLRKLGSRAGETQFGIHPGGRMVGVIGRALIATETRHTSDDAISKALGRGANDKRLGLSREQIEQWGYVIIA